MTGLAVLLGAIGSGVVWIGFVAPTIVRALGVPVAIGFGRLDRKNRHLSKLQWVWAFGAFMWGGGMFLYSTMFDYLSWRVMDDQFSHPRLGHVIVRLVVTVLFGALFVVMTVRDPEVEKKLIAR